MTGWIKLHRRVLDHEVFQDPVLFKVFCWCLLRAAHKQTSCPVRTGRGSTSIILYPGQLIFGRYESAQDLGLKPSTARNKIQRLAKLQILTIKPDTHYSVITIVNWHSYQAEWIEEGQASGHPKDTQRTHTRMIRSKTFLSDSIEVRLAALLFNKILARNPKHKKPNIQTSAKQIDLMIRLDGRTPEDIRRVIEWCQQDSFWQNNILSTVKLREKYDQLALKMGPRSDEW